jgi:ATP-binding protein involved in chromosome partitioning
MKIAIPVEDGRLHGHFGGCRQFALVEVDPDKKVTLRTDMVSAPDHRPGLFPRWLREQGVQVVIAGGIGWRALANFAHHGITVRAGTPGATVEQLVSAYLNGELTLTPDGCGHHGHDHDHHHHHGHEHGNHHCHHHHHGHDHGQESQGEKAP